MENNICNKICIQKSLRKQLCTLFLKINGNSNVKKGQIKIIAWIMKSIQ